jgi:hypothetical protein
LWEESVPGKERGEGEQLLRSEAGGPAYGVQTAYQSLVLRKQRLRPFTRLGNSASFYTFPDVKKKKIKKSLIRASLTLTRTKTSTCTGISLYTIP